MPEAILANHSNFVLLDANVVAGYYIPDSLSSIRAKARIENIINSVRLGGSPELLLYIPNFCISEVLAVFARYTFATWDRRVKKALTKKLKKEDFDSIIQRFHKDFANGIVFNEVDLNRYHILATNLISRIDANYQHYRTKKKQKKMMGAADHSIIGMGIQLSKVHGRDNFVIITADNRLSDILTRASTVPYNTARKLGLFEAAINIGLPYSKNIYPQVINLAKATKKQLRDFFGLWPLPETRLNTQAITKLSMADCEFIAKLREKSGIGRDSIPYTQVFEDICRKFERRKGQRVDRNSAWKAIGRIEKKGKAKINIKKSNS